MDWYSIATTDYEHSQGIKMHQARVETLEEATIVCKEWGLEPYQVTIMECWELINEEYPTDDIIECNNLGTLEDATNNNNKRLKQFQSREGTK